jgi:hypothetical protein
MKGKSKGVAPKASIANNKGFFAGGNSSTAKGMKGATGGFKKGGKVEGVMSMAHAGRKPRKSGGSVMSSAAKGTQRPGMC